MQKIEPSGIHSVGQEILQQIRYNIMAPQLTSVK